MTVGPYLPVLLHRHTSRIKTLNVRTQVDTNLRPSLLVSVELSGDEDAPKYVHVKLLDRGNTVIREQRVAFDGPKTEEVVKWEFASGLVDLWWPVGYGEQILYIVEVVIEDEVRTFSSRASSSL